MLLIIDCYTGLLAKGNVTQGICKPQLAGTPTNQTLQYMLVLVEENFSFYAWNKVP